VFQEHLFCVVEYVEMVLKKTNKTKDLRSKSLLVLASRILIKIVSNGIVSRFENL
jgi:hypothetical protein